ncbi:ATPase, T2SS/T4P/T4SS family [Clostridium guangxiense]|uniref:ATPase, T2SS/T4P/T4SS family n=1 Tax=Clostridium guangxiense TaxID=1662055 RepID=UPI001E3312A0|nr:ATPase, T2SS/T4P/T4SS family [Clostridium guangxiense]MCD2345108.1 Flp pilus assembly complex ATPase component TadA [Clostridium guangxiense]
MNRVNLVEELNYNKLQKNTNSTSTHNKEIISLVDNIIKEFTEKKSYLINDVEKGALPESVIKDEVLNYLDKKDITFDVPDRNTLIKKVIDYLFGYYLLQDLIEDDDISDIKVLAYDNVQVKIKGKRVPSNIKFTSKESYGIFFNYLVVKLGGTLDKRNAVQLLEDKTQEKFYLRITLSSEFVNSNDTPYIVIRKIPKNKVSLELLMGKYGMMNKEIYYYLVKAARAGLNVFMCGKGGSGKTTLINAMIDKVPFSISGLVIQEIEELHSEHPNMMFQKVKLKVGESDVEYSLSKLSRQAMTEDIDMIVIGEIKGKEAMDLFKIMGTGHIGWASGHTNSSKEAPDKLIDYMEESGTNLERSALLKMLSAIDVIVFMKDFKIMEVTEVVGFNEDKKELNFNPIFKFNKGEFNTIGHSCSKINEKIKYSEYLETLKEGE